MEESDPPLVPWTGTGYLELVPVELAPPFGNKYVNNVLLGYFLQGREQLQTLSCCFTIFGFRNTGGISPWIRACARRTSHRRFRSVLALGLLLGSGPRCPAQEGRICVWKSLMVTVGKLLVIRPYPLYTPWCRNSSQI